MKIRTMVGIGLWFILLLSACAKSNADPLAGTAWNLARIDNSQVLEGFIPSLQFQDGVASGSTGCNEYSTPYSINGAGLTLEEIVVTERACMDQRAMGQEGDYLRLLSSVKGFLLTADGQLELLDAGQEVLLIFMPAP
jgi:heat shock protein HslJ